MKTAQSIVAFTVLLAITACAPTSVEVTGEVSGQLPKPDRILVYDFAVTPDEVKLDSGLEADVKSDIEHTTSASARSAQEVKIGHAVANAISDELVKAIQGYGFPAERGLGLPAPSGGHTYLVKGQLFSIDEGNSTERVVIGLGAGRNSVQARVQFYELTPEGLSKVESMRGEAKGMAQPGMAETMGVGAIAGHLLVSTLVSGALTAGNELSWGSVNADSKRLAKAVAADLEKYFISQGWLHSMPQ
ncbi:MAG TPA: DUF4410 domain-containing protein [Nitrospiria bacterium]|nr:DUF4410 domain-containing protein [Nitrospiria bacterium]